MSCRIVDRYLAFCRSAEKRSAPIAKRLAKIKADNESKDDARWLASRAEFTSVEPFNAVDRLFRLGAAMEILRRERERGLDYFGFLQFTNCDTSSKRRELRRLSKEFRAAKSAFDIYAPIARDERLSMLRQAAKIKRLIDRESRR